MKNKTKTISVNKKQVKAVKKKTSPLKKNKATRKNKSGLKDFATLRKRSTKPRDSGNAEKYWNILENIQDGCFEVDLPGNFTFLNDSVCRVLGYSREEMMKMNVRQLSDKETLKKVFQATNEVYKTGKSIKEFGWQVTRKDGAERYIQGSISLRKDSSGNPIGFLVIANDFTDRKQTEDALCLSEEKYRNILENIQEGYFEVDLFGNLTFFNDSMCLIMGYSKEELMGMNNLQHTDKENARKVFQAFNKVYNTGKPINELYWQIIRKDGTKRHIESSVSLLQDSSGKPTGFRGIARDITERKQIEEKMHESEKLYRAIFENTGTATLIISGDDFITLANTEFERLTGYTRGETENKKRWMEFIVKDDLEKMQKQRRIRMENEKDALRSYEFRLLNKAGDIKHILLFIDMIGSTKQTVCSLLDITERKKAEEALKNSEAKFRDIFENAIEGIYQSTIEGRFITVNAALARMAGYESPEEFIESVKDIETQLYVYSEDRKRFLGIIEAKGFINSFEVEFFKKDGSTFWVVINARTVKDKQVKILYMEGLIEDITIRKRAEELLHRTLDSLKKSVGTTIQVLVSAVESRDSYTAGHQSRSANLACAIATEMGLAPEKIEGIRMAGIIHDIGKLSIPAEILSKPTKLTDIEFALIKEHSRSGYEMLKDVESPWPLAEIVYQHHERMNGSGYPRNLKGDEIIMESQILAVADVVEAMASHRPYRPTLGIEAALEEIEKNKGILYDDAVTDTCLKLFREKGYQLYEMEKSIH